MNILYFSLVDWDYIRQRPHHLTERLAAYHNIVFLQPFGLRNVKPSDIGRVFKRFGWFFKKKNLKSGLYIKNLFFIPIINTFIRRINIRILRPQLQSLIDDQTIVWVTTPSQLIPELLERLNYRALIYEMMDDYLEIYPSPEVVSGVESWLINRADLIIVTSEALAEKSKAINRDRPVKIIGNGVDYDFFNRASSNMPAPSPSPLPAGERVRAEQKIVGYIGTIDKWIDFEIIDSLAERWPDLNLVFAGPIKIKNLPERKNIHFLGKVDYNRIPALCNSFDVCLIPFKPVGFADTVNPLKLYEYFALGKPVVAYRMRELQPYADLLYLAEDQNDFFEKVSSALNEKGSEIIKRRKEVARLNDWSIKAGMLQEILLELDRL